MINRNIILACLDQIDTPEGVKRVLELLHGDEISTTVTSATTSTSLVDIPGLLLPLDANYSYEIEVLLYVESSTFAGTKYGLDFSAMGASLNAVVIGQKTDVQAVTEAMVGWNTPTTNTFMTAGTPTGFVWIRGIVSTALPKGNLTVQQLKVTSGNAGAQMGSCLRARKVAFYG
jgi:hypothetical protein